MNVWMNARIIVEELVPVIERKYHVKLPKINVVSNNRLTRFFGRASISGQGTAILEVAGKVFEGKTSTKAFRDTVIHELCHIADYTINGYMSDHGSKWKEIVLVCGSTPKKFVSEDELKETGYVKPVRKVKRYEHKCLCMTHKVGGQVHNKILKGSKYTCNKCGYVLA